MVIACVIVWFRTSLNNGIKVEIWGRIDEGYVEDFGTEAIPNNPHVVLSRRHSHPVLMNCKALAAGRRLLISPVGLGFGVLLAKRTLIRYRRSINQSDLATNHNRDEADPEGRSDETFVREIATGSEIWQSGEPAIWKWLNRIFSNKSPTKLASNTRRLFSFVV
jgi:hypothetical protein